MTAPSWIKHVLYWSAPVIFAVSVATGIAVPGRPPDDAGYYEAVAQIIPTIVVALAIESRAGRTWRLLHAPAFPRLIFGSLLVAEIAAVFAASELTSVKPRDTAEKLVTRHERGFELLSSVATAGLIVGFVSVLIIGLYVLDDSNRVNGSPRHGVEDGEA